MTSAPILRFFETDHLPDPLRTISEPFGRLARQLDQSLPAGPELSTALQKLLEAKDAAVRAGLLREIAAPPVPDPGITERGRRLAEDSIVLPANTPQPG